MAVAGPPARRFREEVSRETMRKYFALSMVALLALTLAIAAMGCGKKQEETPAASSESSSMSSTPTDTSASAAMDTTMKSDTTMKK